MIRGVAIGAYPYFFLDVEKIGYSGVLLYVVAILAFFKFLAFLLVRFDRSVKNFDTGKN
jgi:NADH:ubiquinone oxidoreductase subunit 6 (subunit J)